MVAKLEGAEEIACSLSGAEFRQRRAFLRETLLPHLLLSKRTASGLTLAFPNTDACCAQLETFVSLERQCCGFLTFTISWEEDPLTLRIEGPPEAAATIAMFARIIEGHAP